MLDLWDTLSYTTKFSAIGFVLTFALGLLSMGFLGLALYYPVSFLFRGYPALNDWRGDWVWPAVIVVGMGWSIGFLLGGLAWYFLAEVVSSFLLLRIIYGLILWSWAAVLWYWMIRNNL